MSQWQDSGQVLVGQGSAEPVPASPRCRWTPGRPQGPVCPQEALMGKAKELFELCDKEGKGFITKRDMQRLEGEVPLSPEQLETVFESLDRHANGFLTPLEFSAGLGDLVSLQDTVEEPEDRDLHSDGSHDASALRFANTLSDLCGDRLFRSHAELCALWTDLQRDSPALGEVLEELLPQALSHLHDSIRDRESLEQALHRREAEHEQRIRSLYEEMENQIKEEREKQAAEDSVKQKQKNQQLQKELRNRTQELELSQSKHKEAEVRLKQMSREQSRVKEQNQQLQRAVAQLQEQLENSQHHLQTALSQLSLLQDRAEQETLSKQRNVLKVSRNMQKEKDSLMRQLELLRDMNKRLRDEKDARLETQRRLNHKRPLNQHLFPP